MTTTTFTWTFPAVEKIPSLDGLTDVIRTVHWRLRAERDGETAEIYGSETLAPAVAATFLPFAEITKEVVTTWIETHIGDRLAEGKANLETQLDAKLDPAIIATTPVSVTPDWS
jgi:hypothetical protein